MSRVEGWQGSASAWVMRRPHRGWWLTLAGLFLITAAVPAATIEYAVGRGSGSGVFVVTWMVILGALPLLFPHLARRRFDEVVALLCIMCLAPTMLALWAAVRGGGRWLPITGWVVSTLAADLVMRRAVRDAATARRDRQPPPLD